MVELVKAARAKDVPPGTMVTIPGIDLVDVCLINQDGKYYALSNVCTHKGAPLNTGTLNGKYLVCPWHKANFRIEDGKHNWPASRSLRSFGVEVDGDYVYVAKPPRR